MQYYKDENNNFYAYEDGVTDIKKGLIKSSREELKSYQAQRAIDNHVAEKQEIAKLQKYLDDTDYVARKLTECIALGNNVEELLSKHSKTFGMTNREIIIKSEQARAKKRELISIL